MIQRWGIKNQADSLESDMFEIGENDRCVIFLNESLGIAYEFVDAFEKVPRAVLRKEDHDFLISIRNVVALTLIITAVMFVLGDSKIKFKDKVQKQQRIVKVVIPEKKKELPPDPPKAKASC